MHFCNISVFCWGLPRITPFSHWNNWEALQPFTCCTFGTSALWDKILLKKGKYFTGGLFLGGAQLSHWKNWAALNPPHPWNIFFPFEKLKTIWAFPMLYIFRVKNLDLRSILFILEEKIWHWQVFFHCSSKFSILSVGNIQKIVLGGEFTHFPTGLHISRLNS